MQWLGYIERMGDERTVVVVDALERSTDNRSNRKKLTEKETREIEQSGEKWRSYGPKWPVNSFTYT